jgi:ubiquinone/menaquinone biosynthesis C-methylase UbiE
MHKFDPKSVGKLDSPERRKELPPQETLERFGLRNIGGTTFLDIGCGIGYFTVPAAQILTGGNVIGIDVLDEMLEHAWERCDELTNIDFRKSEPCSFPVDDNSVDIAFMANVLHEVEDKVKYLLEVKRVLKVEGELYIIEWEKRKMEQGPPVEHRLGNDEVRLMCEKAGFKEAVEVEVSKNLYGLKVKL